ncbi:MAG: hypothetical protein LBS74_00380 [Oscillospiraceae bacterium]|jgi:hypothetical protein|nr:hypothetical protein [Oscillospiraceae bacterium]
MKSKINYKAYIKISWISILALQGILSLCTIIGFAIKDKDSLFPSIDYLPVDFLGCSLASNFEWIYLGFIISAGFVALNAICIAKRRVVFPTISLLIYGSFLLLVPVGIILEITACTIQEAVLLEDWLPDVVSIVPYAALFAATLVGVINISKLKSIES